MCGGIVRGVTQGSGRRLQLACVWRWLGMVCDDDAHVLFGAGHRVEFGDREPDGPGVLGAGRQRSRAGPVDGRYQQPVVPGEVAVHRLQSRPAAVLLAERQLPESRRLSSWRPARGSDDCSDDSRGVCPHRRVQYVCVEGACQTIMANDTTARGGSHGERAEGRDVARRRLHRLRS